MMLNGDANMERTYPQNEITKIFLAGGMDKESRTHYGNVRLPGKCLMAYNSQGE